MPIPKRIHICWFGNNPPNGKLAEYIEKIKGLTAQGYEVTIWDESNYDVRKSPVLYRAYTEKKWSLVSNYIRLDILKTHGGIYLDADIEVCRNFDDLLKYDLFLGFIWDSTLGTAVIGAAPEHPYISDILSDYENKPETYISPNNNTFTDYFINNIEGFQVNGKRQLIGNNLILDKFAFENPSFLKRRNYTIHHLEQSWKRRNHPKAVLKSAIIRIFSLWLYRKYVCWISLRKSPYYPLYRKSRELRAS